MALREDLVEALDYGEATTQEKSAIESAFSAEDQALMVAHIPFSELAFERIVGSGAFGEVILARYAGSKVVMKRMLRDKISDDNLRRFVDEIKLMVGLRHPNICMLIGASWDSFSNVGFVMEYAQRGDLGTLLREAVQPLRWADPLGRMAIDSARGLAYLHHQSPKVLHRDLKSVNILVTDTFGCKIADFGLSRREAVPAPAGSSSRAQLAAADRESAAAAEICGTPLWMAPEIVRQEGAVTAAADIFAFGIILCEMDTRRLPYQETLDRGVSKLSVMLKVAKEGLRPQLSPECVPPLRALIGSMLADDPAARPTVDEVLAELELLQFHKQQSAWAFTGSESLNRKMIERNANSPLVPGRHLGGGGGGGGGGALQRQAVERQAVRLGGGAGGGGGVQQQRPPLQNRADAVAAAGARAAGAAAGGGGAEAPSAAHRLEPIVRAKSVGRQIKRATRSVNTTIEV